MKAVLCCSLQTSAVKNHAQWTKAHTLSACVTCGKAHALKHLSTTIKHLVTVDIYMIQLTVEGVDPQSPVQYLQPAHSIQHQHASLCIPTCESRSCLQEWLVATNTKSVWGQMQNSS